MGRSSDKAILVALPMLAVLAAIYLLVISPKREEASALEAKVAELQAAVTQQEDLAAAAELAKETFPRNYARMVLLGEAVPADSEQASLLVELQAIADKAGVGLNGVELTEGGGGDVPPPPPAPAQTPAQTAEQSEQEVAAAESGTPPAAGAPPVAGTPVPATEASASVTPFGSTIGPAGLPLTKYKVSLGGTYFELADFLAGMDKLISLSNDQVKVNGRLITIDDFTLSSDGSGSGELTAELNVTAYLAPAGDATAVGATGVTAPPTTDPTAATPPPAPVATVPTP
jgi:Tfp pilus assembly protein PilO